MNFTITRKYVRQSRPIFSLFGYERKLGAIRNDNNTEGMAIISQRYLKKILRSVPIMNENEPEKVKGFMLENIILHNIVC